jgi:type IV secretion system protein VirB9
MKRLLLLLLAVPVIVMAETNPPHGAFDPRVRVVDYNAQDVVKLTTFYGVSTHVQFGPREVIKDVAVGDTQAWEIIPRGSHLFIKPKAEKADTNVTVVTDRRVYNFALVVEGRKVRDADAWRDPNLVFSLSFRYPDEEADRVTVAAHETARKEQAAEAKERLQAAKQVDANRDYWVAGSEEISPTAARDDGRFIYLTFGLNKDMPAVYAVDAEGNESLVNTSVEGNEIVVQRMVKQLTLRKGGAVACLVNKSFDLNGGRDNKSGTVAPNVERVIKGAM